MTVVSDGEAALPALVQAATGGPVVQILDWWHVSMRIRHCEQALRGVFALQPMHCAGLDIVAFRLERLRHLLWNGYHDEARRELFGLRHLAGEAVFLNGERLRHSIQRFLWHCGCVDEIANARMAKRQRMRWSPRGAHRVAIVRAAVLDSRLRHRRPLRAAA